MSSQRMEESKQGIIADDIAASYPLYIKIINNRGRKIQRLECENGGGGSELPQIYGDSGLIFQPASISSLRLKNQEKLTLLESETYSLLQGLNADIQARLGAGCWEMDPWMDLYKAYAQLYQAVRLTEAANASIPAYPPAYPLPLVYTAPFARSIRSYKNQT